MSAEQPQHLFKLILYHIVMKKKKNKDVIVINKKALIGIAPAVAIIGVLISKHKPAELLLFLIGILAGIFIAINLKE